MKLPPDVAGKIAAGEVIERPVSVIKELVENSIDASARNISVELVDGGKSSMRVIDDGNGIAAGELPIAVENFSTSKITEMDDIYGVGTLGFRGEALASIRAVSHLTVKTRSRDEDVGREMQWKADLLIKDEPHVRNPGTDITAAGLFFNLPARKKFLSSASSELRRITSLVQSYSLSFPEIAFTLKDNARDILNLPASKHDERVEAVFGPDAFPHLKHFENRIGRMSLHGYASIPSMTRGNRSLQFLFINKRYVKDRLITHAVHQAYQSLIPNGRFPLIVLYLTVPPDDIDVNVHPTKSQIRFKNEREIHRFISSTLQDTFQMREPSFKEKVKSAYRTIFPNGSAVLDDPASSAFEGGFTGAGERPHGASVIAEGRSGAFFQEAPLSLFEEREENAIVPTGNLYWQLHQSYILIQIRGGMAIIDQHAAHERILFNRAKRNMRGEGAAVQSLLFPATLELSPDEYEKFELFESVLPSLGFEVERFGLRSVIVRGVPAGIKNWNEGRLLQEILGEAVPGRSGVDEFLKTFACRSAVKAGTSLSVKEMESLTDQLFAAEFPFTCPHGRPTVLRVDLADLEKRFHRTVSSEK
jgi:DNA mismatch repair protein MutL